MLFPDQESDPPENQLVLTETKGKKEPDGKKQPNGKKESKGIKKKREAEEAQETEGKRETKMAGKAEEKKEKKEMKEKKGKKEEGAEEIKKEDAEETKKGAGETKQWNQMAPISYFKELCLPTIYVTTPCVAEVQVQGIAECGKETFLLTENEHSAFCSMKGIVICCADFKIKVPTKTIQLDPEEIKSSALFSTFPSNHPNIPNHLCRLAKCCAIALQNHSEEREQCDPQMQFTTITKSAAAPVGKDKAKAVTFGVHQLHVNGACVMDFAPEALKIIKTPEADYLLEQLSNEEANPETEDAIVTMIAEYPLKLLNEDVFQFISSFTRNQNFKETAEKLVNLRSLTELDIDDIRILLEMLNTARFSGRDQLISTVKDLKKQYNDLPNIDIVLNNLQCSLFPSKALKRSVEKLKIAGDVIKYTPLFKRLNEDVNVLEGKQRSTLKAILEKPTSSYTAEDIKRLISFEPIIKTEKKEAAKLQKLIDSRISLSPLAQSVDAINELKGIFNPDAQVSGIYKEYLTKLSQALQLYPLMPKYTKEELKACLKGASELLLIENKQFQILESRIFDFAFAIEHKQLVIMQVFLKQLEIFKYPLDSSTVLNMSCSTGSGKTLITPAFFMLRAMNGDPRIHFVMTQPSNAIAHEKKVFFEQNYNFNVFDRGEDLSGYDEPAVLLLSPTPALRYIKSLPQEEFDRTVFCIDESHQRRVESDILYSVIKGRAPLILMSATPDPVFGQPQIQSVDKMLYNVEMIPVRTDPSHVFGKTLDQVKNAIGRIQQEILTDPKGPHDILVFTCGNSFSSGLIKTVQTFGLNLLDVPFHEGENEHDFMQRLTMAVQDMVRTGQNRVKAGQNKVKAGQNKVKAGQNQVKEDRPLILPIKLAGYSEYWQKILACRTPLNFTVDQKKVKVSKLIFSTNAIESSITIRDLRIVVDSGVFNEPTFDMIRGITTLRQKQITVAMQQQRKGRVGRMSPGIVYQVISDTPSDKVIPEIQSVDLGQKILSMRGLGWKLEELSLPTPPSGSQYQAQLENLKQIGALNADGDLTESGKMLCNFEMFSPFIASAIVEYGPRTNESVLFASLIALIASNCDSSSIKNGAPVDSFCAESDLVTIAGLLIDKDDAYIEAKTYSEITTILTQLAFDIAGLSRIGQIWNLMKEYMKGKSMLKEITAIIQLIITKNQTWKDTHYGSFSRFNERGEAVYNGNSCIAINGNSEIQITRPNWQFNTIPTEVVILSIKRDETSKYIQGSIIHMTGGTLQPDFQPIPEILQSTFGNSLLCTYLNNHQNEFTKLKSEKPFDLTTKNIVYISNEQTKALIAKAINECTAIIPFTPRSILVRNNTPLCDCEMVGTGGTEAYSHFYLDHNRPNAYRLDDQMISYLSSHVNELKTTQPLIRLCMTSHGLSMNDKLTFQRPSVSGNSVFGIPNMLFVISDSDIPGTRLTWEPLNQTIKLTTKTDPLDELKSMLGKKNTVNKESIYFVTKNSLEVEGTYYSSTDSAHTIIANETASSIRDQRRTIEVSAKAIKAASEVGNGKPTRGGRGGKGGGVRKPQKVNLSPQETNLSKGEGCAFFVSIRTPKQVIQAFADSSIEVFEGIKLTVDPSITNIAETVSSFGVLVLGRQGRSIYLPSMDVAIAFDAELKAGAKDEQSTAAKATNVAKLYLPGVPEAFYNVPPTRKLINQWICEHTTPIQSKEKEKTIKGDLQVMDSTVYFILAPKALYKGSKAGGSPWNGETDSIGMNPLKYKRNQNWAVMEIGKYAVAITRATRKEIDSEFKGKGCTIEERVGTLYYSAMPRLVRGLTVALRQIGGRFSRYADSFSWFVNFDPDNDPKVLKAIKELHPNFTPQHQERTTTVQYPIKMEGRALTGPVELIEELRLTYMANPITFDYVALPLMKSDGPMQIEPTWFIDRLSHKLVVPKDDKEKAEEFLQSLVRKSDGDEPLFCILICDEDDRKVSKSEITEYLEDGSIQKRPICIDCALSNLEFSTHTFFEGGKFYDDRITERPIFLLKNESTESNHCEWPQIPLGQLLVVLSKEGQLANFAKAWVSARAVFESKMSGMFTSCPRHPDTFYAFIYDTAGDRRVAREIRCTANQCSLSFCQECQVWHQYGLCDSQSGMKNIHRCPRCRQFIIKTDGCNHITCPCGCHWCYGCPVGREQGFDTSNECYRHMQDGHSGDWYTAG